MAKTTSSINYLTANRPRTGDPIAQATTDPVTNLIIEPIGYDSLGRVVRVIYNVGGSGTETVTFSYSISGHIEYNGNEYKNHYLNLWEATIVPMSPADIDAACSAHTANELTTIQLLGLTTANLVSNDADGYELLVMNDGSLIYSPTIA